MTNRLTLLLSAFLLWVSPVAAHETVIDSADDIVRLVEQNNYELKILQENTRRAEAVLNRTQAGFFYPSINAHGSYLDDQREPLSPFLPARTKETFWDFYLKSKTPVGVTVTGGKKFYRAYFGQSEPPNPLLPYPATYYQPQAFVEASLNLTQDFLGYISRKEIAMAKSDFAAAKRQESLLKHKLALTALEMYYQLPLLERIRANSERAVADFSRLGGSVTRKLERSLAEKSDLTGIHRLVADQRALVSDAQRAISDTKRAIAVLLGSETIAVRAAPGEADLRKGLQECEAAVLKTPFNPALSEEFALLEEQLKKATMESKIYQRRILPEVNLVGSAATTGTDSTYGASLDELSEMDNPVYKVGVDFTWQPSAKNFRAAQLAAKASKNEAALRSRQRLLEQKSLWEKSQENIRILREKQAHMNRAAGSGSEQVADLERQYGTGRLSLFELTQQRIDLLNTNIDVENVKRERLANLLDSLQYFNRFQCGLLPNPQP